MRKEKFVYNTHTLRYEKVVESWQQKLLRLLGFICAAVLSAFIITMISHRYFASPREKALLREIDQMKISYNRLLGDMDQMSKVLDNIQQRDAYAHRMIFGMDPIDKDVWEGGIGGHDKYEQYRQLKNAGDVLANTHQRLDLLKRQMAMQSKSLDTVINLAKEKEKMLASMPSIKPVRSDKLSRNVQVLSGFGYRVHPIFKVPKMHYGIDFTAPIGTPIQATGAGKVIKAERGSGYGYHVIIDHGYGYQTLYGHMSRIDVKVGEKVVRGQQIGLVGNTGTSTAPHCHYEVHYRGDKVNPIHYCMDGLTPKEYQELVEAAEAANQSLD
ncbi:MAG TPA: peptidoglycan DD-metalloendopeptidase family protein [Saprospiraceae bacterium]|jgi:hypothetical protein|nr:peptidoglycan DD-metalloendopeptidase family protein [Saprospiraceae bacterium]HMP14120.1 peptidoglycan DD-metalloendopeptidase family protein [Saprospiraceae bacterium]